MMKESGALLSEVASLILKQVNRGDEVACPESSLLSEIYCYALHTSLTANGAVQLLIWQPKIDESDGLRIIGRILYWDEGAPSLGRLILTRYWKVVARRLLTQYQEGAYPILPVLQECLDLFGYFEAFNIPVGNNSKAHLISRNQLIGRVAELGSKVATGRIDDIWQRAGGRSGVLRSYGNDHDRWYDASTKAALGELKCGMLSLLSVLFEDFPHNHDLKTLEQIIREYQ